MEYREDLRDFTAPLQAELDRLKTALNTKVETSRDADTVLGRLLGEKRHLNGFLDELAERVDRRTLWGLPGIPDGFLQRSTRYKVPERGPYRGIFLIDSASSTSVGLIFSVAPHDWTKRLPDLAERWKDLPQRSEN